MSSYISVSTAGMGGGSKRRNRAATSSVVSGWSDNDSYVSIATEDQEPPPFDKYYILSVGFLEIVNYDCILIY